jgi:four helix bundle protein
MVKNEKNIIVEKSFRFALKIVLACSVLEENRHSIIGRQLLKSGTSIGANIREAQGAETMADFIHKIKIAFKEAEETEYWLDLCIHSPGIAINEDLKVDLTELKKILSKIISTAKSRLNHKSSPPSISKSAY